MIPEPVALTADSYYCWVCGVKRAFAMYRAQDIQSHEGVRQAADPNYVVPVCEVCRDKWFQPANGDE